jgi:hypothetical protein
MATTGSTKRFVLTETLFYPAVSITTTLILLTAVLEIAFKIDSRSVYWDSTQGGIVESFRLGIRHYPRFLSPAVDPILFISVALELLLSAIVGITLVCVLRRKKRAFKVRMHMCLRRASLLSFIIIHTEANRSCKHLG